MWCLWDLYKWELCVCVEYCLCVCVDIVLCVCGAIVCVWILCVGIVLCVCMWDVVLFVYMCVEYCVYVYALSYV